MEWRKMKNIIILTLLIVNVALLLLVGSRYGQARRYEQSALEGTLAVLKDRGIAVDREGLAADVCAQLRSAPRSVEKEEALAAALLGEAATSANLGGGLYTYSAPSGQVDIRPGGEISAVLGDHPRWNITDPAAQAAAILAEMGIEARPVELSPRAGQLRFCQTVEGMPVFSGSIVFTFENGRFTRFDGTLVIAPGAAGEGEELLSLPTVLMRFLDGITASGDVCSVIHRVEPGYRTVRSFTGAADLSPVWAISTDAADYYIDARTGELIRL